MPTAAAAAAADAALKSPIDAQGFSIWDCQSNNRNRNGFDPQLTPLAATGNNNWSTPLAHHAVPPVVAPTAAAAAAASADSKSHHAEEMQQLRKLLAEKEEELDGLRAELMQKLLEAEREKVSSCIKLCDAYLSRLTPVTLTTLPTPTTPHHDHARRESYVNR
jgi:acyl-CoA reductase-like NAD-dependent aldehyde dehydrogenase